MTEIILFYSKTIVLGFITGFIIGYAFKKLSKILVIIIGLILILTQFSVYNGILEIDIGFFNSLSKDVFENNQFVFENVKKVVLINLPFSIATVLGFLIGLKKG